MVRGTTYRTVPKTTRCYDNFGPVFGTEIDAYETRAAQQDARRERGTLIKSGILDPNKVFTEGNSLDRVAIEVLDAVHPISEKYNVEIGGLLVPRGEGVSYGVPNVGDETSVYSGDRTHASGSYHTHPGGSDVFSNQHTNPGELADAGLVDLYNVPNYMSSRPGGPNGSVVIKACRPGSPACNPDFKPVSARGVSSNIRCRGLRGKLIRE